MTSMDVISLDDTAETSLFVFDETPIMDEGPKNGATPRKRKRLQKTAPGKNPNSYIVLGGSIPDDSPVCPGPNKRRKRKKSSIETIVIEDDDSDNSDPVIELSDDEKVGVIGGILSGSLETIQKELSKFQKQREKNMKRKKKPKFQVSANSENHTNLYHCPKKPGSSPKKSTIPRKLRPIVIDGSNVAFGHGMGTVFSSRGIQICCDYFKKRGHTVKVFVPQFRRRHHATMDTHILDQLEQERVLVFTPSRRVYGKIVSSYDDRMMVEYAAQRGAVLVTRDNLQDLLKENEAFKEVINDRLLMFTWVDEEIIMFPQDPLGRKGPSLDDFLSFPPEDNSKGENSNECKST